MLISDVATNRAAVAKLGELLRRDEQRRCHQLSDPRRPHSLLLFLQLHLEYSEREAMQVRLEQTLRWHVPLALEIYTLTKSNSNKDECET